MGSIVIKLTNEKELNAALDELNRVGIKWDTKDGTCPISSINEMLKHDSFYLIIMRPVGVTLAIPILTSSRACVQRLSSHENTVINIHGMRRAIVHMTEEISHLNELCKKLNTYFDKKYGSRNAL